MTDDVDATPLQPPPPPHALPPQTAAPAQPLPPGADPFPRDRMSAMVHRGPKYVKLAWRLGKDPMLSKARRVAVVAAAGYVISPVDLVPGFIPVLGQLDDLAFALAALRLALDGLHPDRRRMHLEAVGLEDAHLADDIRTVGATAAWIVRRSLRITGRVLREGAHVAEGGAEIALRATMSVAGRAKGGIGSRLGRAGRRIHGERPNESQT
jgi:uncharacterized membrane protein YkvA (DUF1232 family)